MNMNKLRNGAVLLGILLDVGCGGPIDLSRLKPTESAGNAGESAGGAPGSAGASDSGGTPNGGGTPNSGGTPESAGAPDSGGAPNAAGGGPCTAVAHYTNATIDASLGMPLATAMVGMFEACRNGECVVGGALTNQGVTFASGPQRFARISLSSTIEPVSLTFTWSEQPDPATDYTRTDDFQLTFFGVSQIPVEIFHTSVSYQKNFDPLDSSGSRCPTWGTAYADLRPH